MKKLLIFSILLFSSLNLTAQSVFKFEYKVTKSKAIGWATLIVASAADGMLEGYQFDGRRSFERKYGADPLSWGGSQSWRRAYVNGDPLQGHSSAYAKHLGAWDFYHLADDVRKFGYVGAGLTIGFNFKDQNWKAILLDLIISAIISSGSKRIAMEWVRK